MSKLHNLAREVRVSPFIRHNAVFFAGSLIVSALNYLYYPILGRLLQPVDFGEVQTLLSLYMQVSIFLSVLTYVTIHVTVNSKSPEERTHILLSLERLSLIGGYVFLGLSLLLTPWLKTFLNFSQVWPFVAVIVAIALSIPLAFRMAFLRGSKLFVKTTATDAIGSFTKIIFSVVLVIVGWKAFGAVVGVGLSQIVSLYFGMVWSRRAGFRGFGLLTKPVKLAQLRPQFKYAAAVLLVALSSTIMLSLDILAVKHYFSPQEAGYYAGLTTVARITFFIVAPFSGVMLTMVSLSQPPRRNRLQLFATLGLMSALGAAVILVMSLAPRLIISILVGSKYLDYAAYLPRLALAMLLLGLANTVLMYEIALKRYFFTITALAGLMLTLALVYFNHRSIMSVVNSLLIGILGVFLATGLQALLWRPAPVINSDG